MIATLLGTAAVVIGVHAASLERFLRRSERFDTADRTLLKRAWASSFVVAAWVAWLTGRGAAGRSLLLVAMVTVAGSRWLLQSVMTRRSTLRAPFVRPPQPNQSFRRRVDVLRVFAVQAGVVWLVGLPVALAMADATPPARHRSQRGRRCVVGGRGDRGGAGRLAAGELCCRSLKPRVGHGRRAVALQPSSSLLR